MSDDLNLDNIEEVIAPDIQDEVPTPYEEENTTIVALAEGNEKSEEASEVESEDPIEKSLEELPLPGDETETKKSIPKWVEKKLSRKEQELVQKEQELVQARALLEQRQIQAQTIADPELPKRESFNSDAEFIEAVVDHKQNKSIKNAQIAHHQQVMIQTETNFINKIKISLNEGAEKYEDFEEKTKLLFSPGFPTNRAMAEAIVDSEHSKDIFYFLGQYPEEAKKIALLNPVQAVKKIAEIEGRFEARKKKSVSKAPPPIEGVKTNQVKGSTGNNLIDLARIAKDGNQKDFEKAFNEMRNQSQQEAW